MMDFPIFRRFILTHAARFNQVQTWADKMSRKKEQLEQAIRSWHRILFDFTLEELDRASMMMLENDQFQPRTVEQHPGKLKRLIMIDRGDSAKRWKIQDGRFLYGCAECQDEGWIIIKLVGTAFKNARTLYGEEKAFKMTQAVACTCGLKGGPETEVYKPDYHEKIHPVSGAGRLASSDMVRKMVGDYTKRVIGDVPITDDERDEIEERLAIADEANP